jgi:hypothetical protein
VRITGGNSQGNLLVKTCFQPRSFGAAECGQPPSFAPRILFIWKHSPNPLEETERLIDKLIRLRDEPSEEIPDSLVHSYDSKNRYKVRVLCFQAVITCTCELLRIAPNNPSATQEIKDLMTYFTSEEFSSHAADRVTREDIEKGNQVISMTLDLFGRNSIKTTD